MIRLDEAEKYTKLTTPIIGVDAYLEGYDKGYDKGLNVIDKIRAEIMNLTDGEKPERVWNVDVLQIIDKYKAESEE